MEALFDYMTESERDLAIFSRLTENRLNHIGLEIDKLIMEHAENISACELKVLMESGDSADLELFYAAEAEQVQEKSKGILGRIFAAIGALIRKIKGVLFGKTEEVKEENLPDKIELAEDPKKVISDGNKIMNGIKAFFSNNKEALKDAAKAFAAGAAVTGGTYALVKSDAIPVIKDLKEFINKTEQQVKESEAKAQNTNATPEELADVKENTSLLQKCISKAQNILSAITKAAGGDPAFKEIQQKNKDERDTIKKEKEDAKVKNAADELTSAQEAGVKNAQETEELVKENKELQKSIDATKRQITADIRKKGNTGFSDFFKNFDKLYSEYKELASKRRSPEENERLNKIATMFDKASIFSSVKSLRDMEVKIQQNEHQIARLRKESARNEKNVAKAQEKSSRLTAKQNATKY